MRERALYLHRTGRVELPWALTPEMRDGDEPELLLDTGEMASVVAQFATALGRRPYTEISNAGRGRRRFARVDWWFHLATAMSGANGAQHWTGLKFPGDGPLRAQNWSPAMPVDGYAWKQPRARVLRLDPYASSVSDVTVGAISDLRGYLPDPSEFEGCDLVAIAGDVCPDARPVETHAWLRDVFAPWLDALPAPAVGIAGNHDFIFHCTN